MKPFKSILCDDDPQTLDALCGGTPGSPIRNKAQAGFKVRWKRISKDWLEHLRDRWWSTNYQGRLEAEIPATAMSSARGAKFIAHARELLGLRDRLLAFAGDQACLPANEPDLAILQTRGQFWPGEPVTMKRMRAIRCHENASMLWCKQADRYLIATGYALSDDGMWRQHSWIVEPDTSGKKPPMIIETTERRVAYFGAVLNYEESVKFAEQNNGDFHFSPPVATGATTARKTPRKGAKP